MSKNLQKTLAGALATMSVMSIATPVMATTVDIDALYKNAYDAMRKAQETQTQTDINAAMELIWELRHIGDERKDENLINAACTWSSLVDEVQHPKLVKIVTAITKAQESGRQADINEAFATIEPELPAVWRSSYTSAIDLVQQKLQDELVKAVEKAEADKTEESIKDARELVNEVLTANSEAMVEWAKIFEAKLDNIVGDGTGDDDYLIDDEIQDGTGDDDCLIDQEAYDLKITDVEVNRKQIKVTFDALEKSLDDVTLTVVDNNGNEVKVKSVAIIKKGATEAKFEFNNYLPEKPTGVWTINGEKFNLTEKAFVEDVKANLDNEKLNEVLEKKEYKGLVTYNTKRVENYAKELQQAELKEVKDIQDIIDKVDAELDKQESSNSEKNKYINLIKEVSKNGNQEQFNNVLNEGVEAGYIKDVNPDYMEDYKKEIEKNSEDIKEIANIQTQIKSVNDGKQKEADQKNEEAINKAKTDLKTALEESDKKAILEALQNSFLGLDNVKAENIDAYYNDKAKILSHFDNTAEELSKVNKFINVLNAKVNVVKATNLNDMLDLLKTFAEVRDISEFNVLLSENKQDAAEELLKITYNNGELTYVDKDLKAVDDAVKAAVKEVKDNLTELKSALEDKQKQSSILKTADASNRLRDALKEIIGKEVKVNEEDAFYEASVNSKGELTSYTNYTQVRTVFNGLK